MENYAIAFKSQVSDEELLGGKLSPDDKKKILDACKDTMDWLAEYDHSGTQEDFEEQKEKLSRVAHSITSKLYKDQSGTHDEL